MQGRKINHYLVMDILYFIVFLVSTVIVYKNIETLNKYSLLFIKFGATLLLILLFFTIKKLIKLIKKINYYHYNSSNIVKYSVIFIILLALFLVYKNQSKLISYTENEINSVKFKEIIPIKLSGDFSTSLLSQTISSDNEAVRLCKNRVNEDSDIAKRTSPIDISFSIIETKEFSSMSEAESYRKKYTTFDLSSPLCNNQNPKKVIAIMVETRHPNFIEPLSGMRLDKENGVVLCDESGNYLKRGYSWECENG